MKRATFFGVLIACQFTWADGRVSFGATGDNSGGCDIPDIYLSGGYESADGRFEASGRVDNKGNRACRETTSVDLSLRFLPTEHVSVTLGYDQRGVSFVGPDEGLTGDHVYFGAMKAPTATIAWTRSVDGWHIDLGYDVPNEVPKAAVGWRGDAGEILWDIDGNGFGTVSGRLALAAGFELTAGWTTGLDRVPDPIAWRSDAGLLPAAPPNESWRYAIGWGVTF